MFRLVDSNLPSALYRGRATSEPDLHSCPGYMPFYSKPRYARGRQPLTRLGARQAALPSYRRKYSFKKQSFAPGNGFKGSRGRSFRGNGSRFRVAQATPSVPDASATVLTCEEGGNVCSGADRFHVGDIRVRVTNITTPQVVAGCYPEKADSDITATVSTQGVTYTNVTESLGIEADEGLAFTHRRMVIRTFLNHPDWRLTSAGKGKGARGGLRSVQVADPSSQFVASLFGGAAPSRWFTAKYEGDASLKESALKTYKSGSSSGLDAKAYFKNFVGGPVQLQENGVSGTTTPGNFIVVDVVKFGMSNPAYDVPFPDARTKRESKNDPYSLVHDADASECVVRSTLNLYWRPLFRSM